jgi:hypothetical protein
LSHYDDELCRGAWPGDGQTRLGDRRRGQVISPGKWIPLSQPAASACRRGTRRGWNDWPSTSCVAPSA